MKAAIAAFFMRKNEFPEKIVYIPVQLIPGGKMGRVYVDWLKYIGRKFGHVRIANVRIITSNNGNRHTAQGTLECDCGRTIVRVLKSSRNIESTKFCSHNCDLFSCKRKVDTLAYVREYESPKGRKTVEHTRRIYVKVAGHPRFIYGVENIQSIISHKKDIMNFAKHPLTNNPLVIHYKGKNIMVLPFGTIIPHYVAVEIAKHMQLFVDNWANVPDFIKTKLTYGSNTREKKRRQMI